MGLGGIGVWQLVIILLIVFMLFGTKKLRNMGSDLGGALKGFKNAMGDDDKEKDTEQDDTQLSESAEDVDGSAVDKTTAKKTET